MLDWAWGSVVLRGLLCGHVMQVTVLMSTVVQSLALEQSRRRREVWAWWDSQVVGRVWWGVGAVGQVVRRDRGDVGVCVSCRNSLRKGGC